MQEAFGSYNAKRQYMPAVLAQRLGLAPVDEDATLQAQQVGVVRVEPESLGHVLPRGHRRLGGRGLVGAAGATATHAPLSTASIPTPG